ncbi:membrane protein [Enterococcus ratti]|uniref:Membrane protein n=2 Tax=Enterococcus ratti TaxID=150033 RepID=A0A1L8WP82_9ENTE|nr:membrane protein [Enterococcus ratti]
MGYDKYQAKKGSWRVPENNLIFVSLLGGGAGGLISREVFHHKTRKKKFTIGFTTGVVIDLILIYFFH